MQQGLSQFTDVVPDYEVRDGRMCIRMCGVELVMPLWVFEAGCRRAAVAIAEWNSETRGEVIPFEARGEH